MRALRGTLKKGKKKKSKLNKYTSHPPNKMKFDERNENCVCWHAFPHKAERKPYGSVSLHLGVPLRS